jgi:chromosome partitioning protein
LIKVTRCRNRQNAQSERLTYAACCSKRQVVQAATLLEVTDRFFPAFPAFFSPSPSTSMTDSSSAPATAATPLQNGPKASSLHAQPTTISTINFKGGVGKTTSCLNLAAAAYEEGFSVLILDLDPQGSATEFAKLDQGREAPTLYDWLAGESALREVAVDLREGAGARAGEMLLCPADERLTKIQALLYAKGKRSYLKDALRKEGLSNKKGDPNEGSSSDAPDDASRLEGDRSSFLSRFDFVFLDVPPSVSALSDNVVLASDLALLVLSCQFMSLNGLRRFTEMLRRARRAGADPDWYILPTFYRPTEIESSLVWSRVAEVAGVYPEGRLLSPIGRFAAFGQAFQTGTSIFEYDRAHRGAEQISSAFAQIQEAARRKGAPSKKTASSEGASTAPPPADLR